MTRQLAKKLGIAVVLALGVLQLQAFSPLRAHGDGNPSPPDEEGGLELPMGTRPRRQGPPFAITQGSLNQAVGFYSHGSLVNASAFPLGGDGFLKILRPRNRKYGTFDIRAVVEIAAAMLRHDFPGGERIQIGDVAQKLGGSIGHISHENGLDADIVYLRENHEEQAPNYIAPTPTGFGELFVTDTGASISPNFDVERNWEFVKDLHSTGRIVRIFMDSVIKVTLCQYARRIGEYDTETDVLRRIRPLSNHRDHMHVRITCPDNSPDCQAQEDPPLGSGCDEVLATPPDRFAAD